jgi:hypothetical protein
MPAGMRSEWTRKFFPLMTVDSEDYERDTDVIGKDSPSSLRNRFFELLGMMVRWSKMMKIEDGLSGRGRWERIWGLWMEFG